MKKKSKKGFTIIEVLIAAFILTMSGVAAILVEKQSIQSGAYEKHKIQANALAQEGLNGARQIYYTQILPLTSTQITATWFENNGWSAQATSANGYRILKNNSGVWSLDLDSTPTGENIPLTVGNSTLTFNRKIKIDGYANAYRKITVWVYWNEPFDASTPQAVKSYTYIRNVK